MRLIVQTEHEIWLPKDRKNYCVSAICWNKWNNKKCFFASHFHATFQCLSTSDSYVNRHRAQLLFISANCVFLSQFLFLLLKEAILPLKKHVQTLSGACPTFTCERNVSAYPLLESWIVISAQFYVNLHTQFYIFLHTCKLVAFRKIHSFESRIGHLCESCESEFFSMGHLQ